MLEYLVHCREKHVWETIHPFICLLISHHSNLNHIPSPPALLCRSEVRSCGNGPRRETKTFLSPKGLTTHSEGSYCVPISVLKCRLSKVGVPSSYPVTLRCIPSPKQLNPKDGLLPGLCWADLLMREFRSILWGLGHSSKKLFPRSKDIAYVLRISYSWIKYSVLKISSFLIVMALYWWIELLCLSQSAWHLFLIAPQCFIIFPQIVSVQPSYSPCSPLPDAQRFSSEMSATG